MKPRQLLASALATVMALGACHTPDKVQLPVSPSSSGSSGSSGSLRTGPRILVVTAHPDDEIAFAGTIYKASRFLDGTCDVVVITNGEAGFKYATLAEPLYGFELTEEEVGRARLPGIRREELLAGCEVLGVHSVRFLGERDHRYSQDANEVLGPDAKVWDVARVQGTIGEVLKNGAYDFVFVLAPTAGTHAHHKAAAILTLRAILAMPEGERPAVLCARSGGADEKAPEFDTLDGWPETATAGAPPFTFDRTQRFGFRERLDYRIVVNWAIAEHKSQGTMQLLVNAGEIEYYFLFAASPPGATERARALFESLRAPQFPSKTYGESAGTNADGSR